MLKKSILRKFKAFIFLLLVAKCAIASHLVGGDLVYKYLGSNQYSVQLTIYRDCRSMTPFDTIVNLSVFDSSSHFIQVFKFHFKSITPVTLSTNSPCLKTPGSDSVCYQVAVYDTVLTLPPIKGGYQLVHQRCCRNTSILNLNLNQTPGASYYTSIPDMNRLKHNSSPVFKNNAPTFICAQEPFSFDQSATDADGDSLTYSICAPYDGGSSSNPKPDTASLPLHDVLFLAPYSLANVMNTTPPLSIDPKTGLMTVIPSQQGQFVFAVCVNEFRNGQWIGETKRDIQINVRVCERAVVSSAQAPNYVCGSRTVAFANNSTGADHYEWNFGDTASGKANISTTSAPTYQFSNYSNYKIRLVAYSSALPQCNDTSYRNVGLIAPSNAGFLFSLGACDTPNKVIFINTSGSSIDTNYNYNWDFGDGGVSTVKSPTYTYATTASYTALLTVTSSIGNCIDTVSKTINFSLYKETKASVSKTDIAIGDSSVIQAFPTASNFEYHWINSFGQSFVTTNPNLTVTPTQTTTYYLRIVDTLNPAACEGTDATVVRVHYLSNCDPQSIFVPSGFSPNNDGNNDVLYIRSTIIKNIEMLIFNRWGDIIATIRSTEEGWDGTYNGKPVDSGVYIYYLKYTCILDNAPYLKKGNITLVR